MTNPLNRNTPADIMIERAGSAPFRLSWGAVFAGLVVALVLQLVLTLAGTAVGLAAWDPHSGSALGVGAAIWAIVSILLSLFIGGATAGWAAGALTRPVGMLHGTLVWALSTLVMTWLVASGIGAIAGTTFSVVGNVLGATAGVAAKGAGAAISAVASNTNVNAGDIQSQVATILRQTGDPALSPDSLRTAAQRAAGTATQTSASNGDVATEIGNMISGTASQINRTDVINVIVARTGVTRPEAERTADRLIALRQTASTKLDSLGNTIGTKVGQTAESAASATSSALWIAILGLGLSLAAAVFGASRSTAARQNM
ncbi:MAG: hypothetical protein ACR2M1_10925 [Gemmatimonadaceae bacterium]